MKTSLKCCHVCVVSGLSQIIIYYLFFIYRLIQKSLDLFKLKQFLREFALSFELDIK